MEKPEQNQLCWTCSTNCEWMKNLKPVDGWTADKIKTKKYRLTEWTYQIRECPKYNPVRKPTKATISENIMNLFEATYIQAVDDDYRKVCEGISAGLMVQGVSKRITREHIKENSEKIKDSVRKKVYQEALNYGYNTKRIRKENIKNLVEIGIKEFYGR